MTDGNQTGEDKLGETVSLRNSVAPLKALDAKIIAVAIGSVDKRQLLEIVQNETDILSPKNFDDLRNYVKTTVSYSCRGIYYVFEPSRENENSNWITIFIRFFYYLRTARRRWLERFQRKDW